MPGDPDYERALDAEEAALMGGDPDCDMLDLAAQARDRDAWFAARALATADETVDAGAGAEGAGAAGPD